VLKDLQRVLARAFTSDAPLDVLRAEAASLSPEEQAWIAAFDPDAVRLTGFIVRKLRFERICRGDPRAEAWFERDPAAFVRAFKAYNAEIPPVAIFPSEEAEAFRAWCAATGNRELDGPGRVQ
jgi:hypothetical protein